MDHPHHEDPEKGHDEYNNNKSTRRTALFKESAGMLALWSLYVINEGVVRFLDLQPSIDLFSDSDGRPPKALLFFGSVLEVLFGLLGMYVGLSAFLLNWHSRFVSYIVMIIQTLAGFFVFGLYVFVVPILSAVDLEPDAVMEGLSLGQNRFLIALQVLTSFHFCLALQGGQFALVAQLMAEATGRDFLKMKTGKRMRAIFWNGNMALAGLWTVITGGIINSNVGSGRLAQPYVLPPNVGFLPLLTIFAGLAMLGWGIVGMVIAFFRTYIPGIYFVVSGIVFLFTFINYTMAQVGLLPTPPSGALAALIGLVFQTMFIGPYFIHLLRKEQEGEQE